MLQKFGRRGILRDTATKEHLSLEERQFRNEHLGTSYENKKNTILSTDSCVNEEVLRRQ